uniref:anthranilate synthase component I family protein n=1 Tax=Zhouia sp. PK063 TaxID=3373602 RepID=UPI0037DC0DE7
MKLLQWASSAKEVLWLDSNKHTNHHFSFDGLLALGCKKSLTCENQVNAFQKLATFHQKVDDYIFGYLSYDLKNDVEELSSSNFDGLNFPELFFFQPKKIIKINGDEAFFEYLEDEIAKDLNEILNTIVALEEKSHCEIKPRILKERYLDKVNMMKSYINRGDIYEANFCQEFYDDMATIHPLSVYHQLNQISNPPFACFFRNHHHYLISASPERFAKKKGTTIISQPIKGTSRRAANKVEDDALKFALAHNEKERAENIMIVDLVRNDVSKIAKKGSVTVDELCKIYTFDQVHQMISTIRAEIQENQSLENILKALFPMGSMTGAPKLSAMKIIEDLEETKRGLYSGSVGYITPNGDFDFNVIIRSILYNEKNKYVSFSVGSAITAKSDAEMEYEECLIKAKAMLKVLQNNF